MIGPHGIWHQYVSLLNSMEVKRNITFSSQPCLMTPEGNQTWTGSLHIRSHWGPCPWEKGAPVSDYWLWYMWYVSISYNFLTSTTNIQQLVHMDLLGNIAIESYLLKWLTISINIRNHRSDDLILGRYPSLLWCLRSSPVGDDSLLGQPKDLIRTSKSDRMKKKSAILWNVASLELC